MINNILEPLATSQPDNVLKHEEAILQVANQSPNNLSYTASLLVKLSTDKARAAKYLNLFAGQLTAPIDSGIKINLLVSMRTIAQAHAKAKLLDSHRALVESVMGQWPALKDYCQSVIDTIEGRSLEAVSTEVAAQKQNVTKLDTKVTETRQDVKHLKADVSDTQKTVAKVKTNVEQQAVRIESLEETVEETVAKVEVIDKKTLSHAPKWSAAVSKLLNEYAEHDWRSLATRLGYSNDDIRNWATQADPCLSVLDEWFATHKTREATYAVHHVLVDIDRTDAAAIVDEALKAAENVVLDDDDDVDERKAQSEAQAIFLSYQWAHQKHVKVLKRHLEQAGYGAWMDVGQMGGGDKLYGKIDAAMRAAKVVVCCVTDKYAQSANSNREVTLAVMLGKPIIPILVEESKWPPAGALGPIFSEYLYIQFFRRAQDQETSSSSSPKANGKAVASTGKSSDMKSDKYNDKFWIDAKFNELLMQLRYTHPPDTKLIAADSPYKNWWNPPEEVIVIDAKPQTNSRRLVASSSSSSPAKPSDANGNNNSNNINNSNKQSDEKKWNGACDVFISYQWDVQTAVKQLYRRLTELGYKCWLDVMEMGGGDSLYEKIDRGIRNSSVVLSCVTSKYALSANCRREVSLSDALKKPIVPLVLEEGMQWPPEGPMGPVFTQLLYIDFSKDLKRLTSEKCREFDELVSKIELHIAANKTKAKAKASSSSTSSSATAARKQSSNGTSKQAPVAKSNGATKLPSINASSTAVTAVAKGANASKSKP